MSENMDFLFAERNKKMQLNVEQILAFERIKAGGNFFVTGKSGAGKTTLIKALAEDLSDIIFCAPTSSAARLIGGQTIHRLFQLPPYPIIEPESLQPLGRLKRKLLKAVKTIVIDEISMVRGDILRAVDYRLRQCASSFEDAIKPFGGKNMVFVGDFFQLPPVITGFSSGNPDIEKIHEQRGFYAFQSPAWKDAKITPLYLKSIMRQTDPEFIHILNVLRTNDEEEIPKILADLNKRVAEDIPEKAVYLCSTKITAAIRNATKYNELTGAARTFTAQISGQFEPKDYPNEQELHLKIGQRVISTVNAKDFCNGDIGTIINFTDTGVIVRFDSGSQSEVLPTEIPQYRCKIEVDEDGKEKIAIFKAGGFTQIPLIPGYAITIHRSQGMTLPQVVLDIGAGCFTSGQLYVAVSRCRSLDSLFLKQKISEEDIFVDYDVKVEEIFWKVDNRLIHRILKKELAELDSSQVDMLSLHKYYITHFLQFFMESYLDEFDSDDPKDEDETIDDNLLYLEENFYQQACAFYLNRLENLSDAMETIGKISRKIYTEQR